VAIIRCMNHFLRTLLWNGGGPLPDREKILPMTHPYLDFVRRLSALMDEGWRLPTGGLPSARPTPGEGPEVLMFAPHPDDESIVGALPLRLLREQHHRISVVPLTLGRLPERRSARLRELQGACDFLGFGLVPDLTGRLGVVHPHVRETEPARWREAVHLVAALVEDRSPRMVVFPHARDQNTTHQGTHRLVLDALQSLTPAFDCLVVETEFWAPMAAPNLMVESSQEDVADLMAAVSFHGGEVQRNPYHLRLPAWMSDNVRRGGELLGGQGGAVPEFRYATLYRLQRWHRGCFEPHLHAGCIVPAKEDLGVIFHQA